MDRIKPYKRLNKAPKGEKNDPPPGKIKKEVVSRVQAVLAEWARRRAKELALEKLQKEAV